MTPIHARRLTEREHAFCVAFHCGPILVRRQERQPVEGETWADVEAYYREQAAALAPDEVTHMRRLQLVREAARRAR